MIVSKIDVNIPKDVVILFSPLRIPAETWPSFPKTSVVVLNAWVAELFLLPHKQAQSLQRCIIHVFTIRCFTLTGKLFIHLSDICIII